MSFFFEEKHTYTSKLLIYFKDKYINTDFFFKYIMFRSTIRSVFFFVMSFQNFPLFIYKLILNY